MTEHIRLKVKGMTCAHCEQTIERALEQAGATEATADFRRGEATFAWPQGKDPQAAEQAVLEAGYQPEAVEAVTGMKRDAAGAPVGGKGYDLAILGSGSAAFAAAIHAQGAGARVVMIEQGTLGGTCVNVGCVPSKALLAAADLYYKAGHNPFAGIRTDAGGVNLAALVAQKDELVTDLRRQKYGDLVGEYGWDVLRGQAHFVDSDTLAVDGKRVRAEHYLIATGASPAIPPIPGLAEAGYLTSTTALELTELPDSMVVIGANAVGLELGQLFLHLGTKVTFIEVVDRIAPSEEPEIGDILTAVLREEGAEVVTSARITRVDRHEDEREVQVEIAGAHTIRASQVLVATGRRPNTRELGLERAGVEIDGRGSVAVDAHLRTTNPKVWAAGDVTDSPQFVYVAAYEGGLAANNIFHGANQAVDLAALPRITFTSPQIASVGMTEQVAAQAGYAVQTSLLPLSLMARAQVNHDTRGLFKLVADEVTGKLLGVHILGENAGDVIYSGVLALKFNLTANDIAGTFGPYLTMAEGMKLAALGFNMDVTKLSCCAA